MKTTGPRAAILTARRQAPRKRIRNDPRPAAEVVQERSLAFPQVSSPNGNSLPRRTAASKAEANGSRPQFAGHTLPPLHNCSIDRGPKPTPIRPMNALQSRDTHVFAAAHLSDRNLQRRPASMQAAASIVPALTPPSTPRTHHLANVDTGMQTDDSFDVETAALVEHLALSALARASESLQNEEEIERLRQKAKTSEERLVALQSSTDHQLLLPLDLDVRSNFALRQDSKKGKKNVFQNNMLSSLQRDEQLRFSRRLAKETCRAVRKPRSVIFSDQLISGPLEGAGAAGCAATNEEYRSGHESSGQATTEPDDRRWEDTAKPS
ncbi:unnamed protein product [Heligmosomoides polygyrus]|uniref:Uncharacterized protein n=1 Tax=Heligmosomoides polygyrus TaxID=6339 RepID=A0A183GB73_HELPZ|nr:unnamed protein product [Heligmosomoides polygyrus]